jgi:hypothetical protein
MSIVVVDRRRIAADVHGEVSDGVKAYMDEGYRKIFALPTLIYSGNKKARPLMGFVGDAVAFDVFLTNLRKAVVGHRPRHVDDLKRLMKINGKGNFRIIIPTDTGAITLRKSDADIHQEHHVGELLVFGGSQAQVDLSIAQAWFMPFLDAYRDGLLPNLNIESLLDGDQQVRVETLLTDEEARKHRRKRRHPFLRTKTHFQS